MESDDDYRSFSPLPESPVQHRRLKRLKKTRVPKKSPVKLVDDLLSLPRVDFAELEALESSKIRGFEDSCEPFLSQSPSEGFDDGKELSSGVDDKELSSGVDDQELSVGFDELRVHKKRKETKRDLEFDDVANEFDGKGSSGFDDLLVHNKSKETRIFSEFDGIADALDVEEDNQMGIEEEETVDSNIDKNEKKRANKDVSNEKKDKKKRVKSSGDDMKPKASSSNKRNEEKERRAHLQQLHAESQRLLRETRNAAFKPVPLVQKPISSVLEKIRRRKLEVSKKLSRSNSIDSIRESNYNFTEVVIKHSEKVFSVEGNVEKLVNLVEEEKVTKDVEPKSDASCMDGSNLSGEQLSSDKVPSQMALEEESAPAFRAPLDDTQDLFGDSQTSDSKDELPCDQNNNLQEEVLAPSFLTMQLKFDSAPDDISSDEEENDKENVDPHPHKLDEGCSSPKGDPVKAFVDDEAEEEDDSDNDRLRFLEDEEDDDGGDLEEFKDMIVTGYKEKPIDNEIRNELHQKWLEEKDASGTDDLLRRLKCGSELREAGLLDEEEDDEEDEESGSEAEEDVARTNVARISTRKAKQMIVHMFSDKDEAFLSSDDEETEKKLVRERLLNKVEEESKLLSPVEDESSREVFGLIKKLNIVSEPKKKTKSSSFSDSMLTGGNSNSSYKSSFLSRVSNHSVPTSRKQGTSMVKTFIFGRDDSNSRSSISMSEDSSDTVQVSKERQPARKVTAKFSSSQTRSSSQTAKSATEAASGTSLFEILKRSSTEVRNQDNIVGLGQNVFAAFKIPKQPIKMEGRTQYY